MVWAEFIFIFDQHILRQTLIKNDLSKSIMLNEASGMHSHLTDISHKIMEVSTWLLVFEHIMTQLEIPPQAPIDHIGVSTKKHALVFESRLLNEPRIRLFSEFLF